MFSSYLTDRFYQVTLRGSVSKPRRLTTGVPQVEARIAACLADISGWMSMQHLKLNLDKTELVFLPGKGCPFRDLAITMDDSVVTSTRTARNLGVTLDDELSFSPNIASVTRSCRFLLYNIRRIRPFLNDKAAQVLIQALPAWTTATPSLLAPRLLPSDLWSWFRKLLLVWCSTSPRSPTPLPFSTLYTGSL
ncbi:uncharacterized protein PAE49_017310 [Odontesthes bonariensis]